MAPRPLSADVTQVAAWQLSVLFGSIPTGGERSLEVLDLNSPEFLTCSVGKPALNGDFFPEVCLETNDWGARITCNNGTLELPTESNSSCPIQTNSTQGWRFFCAESDRNASAVLNELYTYASFPFLAAVKVENPQSANFSYFCSVRGTESQRFSLLVESADAQWDPTDLLSFPLLALHPHRWLETPFVQLFLPALLVFLMTGTVLLVISYFRRAWRPFCLFHALLGTASVSFFSVGCGRVILAIIQTSFTTRTEEAQGILVASLALMDFSLCFLSATFMLVLLRWERMQEYGWTASETKRCFQAQRVLIFFTGVFSLFTFGTGVYVGGALLMLVAMLPNQVLFFQLLEKDILDVIDDDEGVRSCDSNSLPSDDEDDDHDRNQSGPQHHRPHQTSTDVALRTDQAFV